MHTLSAAFLPNSVPGLAARLGIQLQYLLYRFRPTSISFMENVPNQTGNFVKSDASLQESGDGNLIRGIQGNGFRPPCLGCLVSQCQTRELFHVGGLEVEVTKVTDLKTQAGGDAIRPSQGIEDGQAHVGNR